MIHGKVLMQYKDFTFPLEWLRGDETVANAGIGDGACVVAWPGGELLIHADEYFTRGPSGRLEIVTGEILP